MAEFLFWASTIATIVAAFVATMMQLIMSWMQQKSFSADMAESRLETAMLSKEVKAQNIEIKELKEKLIMVSMHAFEADKNSKEIIRILRNGKEVKQTNEGDEKS